MFNSFIVCVNSVIPTFIIMMIGFFCKSVGLIDREGVLRFNKIMFKVFLPVMLFYNVYNSDLDHAVNLKLVAFSFVGVLAEILISIFLTKHFTNEKARRGVMIQGMIRANTAVVGLPIAMELLGDVDLGPVVILVASMVPVFNIASVVALEMYGEERASRAKMIKNIVTNPLIIATLLALAFLALKIKLPSPILSTVKSMSQAASPVMVFLVGAFFSFDKLGEGKKELFITTAFRLLVFPAIFLFAGKLFGFKGAEFVALITVFASSNAVSSPTMAQQLGGDADLAGNIVVLTSLLCPLTIFIWSFLYKTMGVF